MRGQDFLRSMAVAALLGGAATYASAENYSDIWWNPGESGWGVTIADHETNIFGVLYAYRSDSKPVWFTIPGGTFSQGRRIFQGDVYKTTGPSYTNPVFNPAFVAATKVGSASFDFTPPGLASGVAVFSYVIDGVSKIKQIQRQSFGSAAPNWGFDHTDLWFNASESGWGLALAQHGNNIFGVWYTYDTDGQPLWFVLPGGTFSGATSFSGDLYRTTGPYFGSGTFDPAQVVVTKAGSASITFDGTAAELAKVMDAAQSGQDACPGFGANFVTTFGNAAIPRLVCRQAFGSLAPTPAAGTCTGTYSITLNLFYCPANSQIFNSHGNFKTVGVDYSKPGPFIGMLTVDGVHDLISAVTTCVQPPETTEVQVPIAGSLGTSRTGQLDFAVSGLAIDGQFSLGTSTVLGTLTAQYLGSTVLSGQFSCTY